MNEIIITPLGTVSPYLKEDSQLYLEEAKETFENTVVAEEGKKLILRRNENEG